MQRAHLVAAFLGFAALCVGGSALSVWHDRTATLDQAQREIAATAQLLDEHANRVFESGDTLLQLFTAVVAGWDLTDPDEEQRVWELLRARIDRMPQLGAVRVVDAQGRTVLDSARPPGSAHTRGPVASAVDRDAGQDGLQRAILAHRGSGSGGGSGGGLRVGATMGEADGAGDRFTISRALHDADGRVRAVVVLAIRGSYFSRIYGQTGWGTGARLALFTAARERLAEWPPDGSVDPPVAAWPQPWDPPDMPAMPDGTHLTAARQLDPYPVVVVASRPLHEILAGWRERAAWAGAITGGVLAGVGLLFLYALSGIRREEAVRAELVRANLGLDERVRRRTAELEGALRAAETANLAKMKVLATVSHDLRQPLQGLAAFHDLLLKDSPNPDLHRLGGMASASLQAGQRLLDDLLTLSRLEAGVVPVEMADFPVGPLLEQLTAELAAEAEGKGLRLRVVPTAAWVRSDPARLQPILRNLLSNAVKYTTSGGIVVGVRRRDDRVRVEVWDSGQGIPEAELGTIWEEFYQIGNPARDGSRGAGLGLSIVDRTARLLNHPLDVRSRHGRGSVFAVTLPRAEATATDVAAPESPVFVLPVGQAPAARAATSAGRLGGRMILIVEDDPLQRSSLTLLLEQAGAVVVAADSFDTALAMTRATLTSPSAILSDYRLPGGTDGLSGIERLRAALGIGIPAVLLTGELSAELARAAKAARCTVLTKPAQPARILATLAEMTAAEAAA
ncbi:ATP-binding protein [Azospirillum canadense]|uniref:ATP-binding protein n=1 Tax=Azospirillum canadense TaxID=403962 RepID=UPI0022266DBE|nr:ATP-binding protein [Azospirillum canadense]MCW2243760.1 signal transduction histidine kinase/ActR/RegA family two-component response regulator [Azospirillum canadense]